MNDDDRSRLRSMMSMQDKARLHREAERLGLKLGPDWNPVDRYGDPGDETPIVDLTDSELGGATTLEEAIENSGSNLFSIKVLCAAGVSLGPLAYGPFCSTADQVAAHFKIDRRTVQSWKQRPRPMPWKPDWYYSLPQIAYWKAVEFDEPIGQSHFVRAIARVIRGDICTLIKQGVTDPAAFLAAIPSDYDIDCALWDTRSDD
jgi:hypothetical protein